MELVGDNSSIKTIRRQSRRSGIVPEEMLLVVAPFYSIY
jgi:hypothetical protein